MLNHKISWSRTLKYTFFVNIIFALELGLAAIPNVQVTTVLMLILAQKLGNMKEYTFYTFIYILLQGLWWGFSFYLISMFVGWLIWGWVSIRMNEWKVEYQSMIGFVFAFLYGLTFYPLTYLIYLTPFIPYLIADFPFALVMATSNALTIMWLRDILYKRVPL